MPSLLAALKKRFPKSEIKRYKSKKKDPYNHVYLMEYWKDDAFIVGVPEDQDGNNMTNKHIESILNYFK